MQSWIKKPKNRVKAALCLLILSIVLMIANVALYLTKVIDEADLILITLILSYLAITITCLDVLATADVREKTDE